MQHSALMARRLGLFPRQLCGLPGGEAYLRVHVGPVHVDLAPVLVDDVANLVHPLLVHPMRGRVRDLHRRNSVRRQRKKAPTDTSAEPSAFPNNMKSTWLADCVPSPSSGEPRSLRITIYCST
jgi:hypothetical protein